MTLTDFLLARIAEDETVARDWQRHPRMVEIYGGGEGHARLINPERSLAECEAKRGAIRAAWADHVKIESEWGSCQSREEMDAKDDVPDVLCWLALPYADHPDYREEWKP